MLAWITGLLTCEILAEILLQKWAKNDNPVYLLTGIASYIVLAVLFGFAMKSGDLTTINAAWQCGNVLLVSLYGIFVLKEKLSHRQLFGIVLATIAVFLVQ